MAISLNPPEVSGQHVTLTGMATPGAPVTARAVPTAGQPVVLGSVTAAPSGDWHIASDAVLPFGDWVAEATETVPLTTTNSDSEPFTIINDEPEPPEPVPGEGVTVVIEHQASGLRVVVAEADAVEAAGEYRDPDGDFEIKRRVFEIAEIPGYRILFDRHADNARWAVGFEYSNAFLPCPFLAGLDEDEDAPQGVVVRTKTPHGKAVGSCFQIRGQGGAGEIANINHVVGGVIDECTFTFDCGKDSWTAWTQNGWIAPGDLPAHRVRIFEDDEEVCVYELPCHYYSGRWRHQSKPLPVRKTFREACDTGLLPNFDTAALVEFAKPYNKFEYSPMRLAGTTPYQPQTGGRGEIGFVTHWQADLLIDPSMIDTVIAQGESSGTYPWFYRDPGTGAPFNALDYPTATSYSNTTSVMYVGWPSSKYDGGTLAVDGGHSPKLTYVPFLLTGDPWYLEALQGQSMIWFLKQPTNNRVNRFGRYAAWTCLDTLFAALATPDDVPSWLLPKSVLEAQLQQYLDNWMAYFVDGNEDPWQAACQALHLQTNGGGKSQKLGQPAGVLDAPWGGDYVVMASAFAAAHYPQWREHAEWIAWGSVQRTSGTSGWPRGVPSLYMSNIGAGCATAWREGQTAGNVVEAADMPPFEIAVDSVLGFDQYASPFGINIRKVEYMQAEVAGPNSLRILERALKGTKGVAHGKNQTVFGAQTLTYPDYAAMNLATQPDKMTFNPNDATGNELLSVVGGSTIDHVSFLLGALSIAASIGIADTRECWEWLNGQVLANLAKSYCPFPQYYVVPR